MGSFTETVSEHRQNITIALQWNILLCFAYSVSFPFHVLLNFLNMNHCRSHGDQWTEAFARFTCKRREICCCRVSLDTFSISNIVMKLRNLALWLKTELWMKQDSTMPCFLRYVACIGGPRFRWRKASKNESQRHENERTFRRLFCLVAVVHYACDWLLFARENWQPSNNQSDTLHGSLRATSSVWNFCSQIFSVSQVSEERRWLT